MVPLAPALSKAISKPPVMAVPTKADTCADVPTVAKVAIPPIWRSAESYCCPRILPKVASNQTDSYPPAPRPNMTGGDMVSVRDTEGLDIVQPTYWIPVAPDPL